MKIVSQKFYQSFWQPGKYWISFKEPLMLSAVLKTKEVYFPLKRSYAVQTVKNIWEDVLYSLWFLR